MKNIKNIFAVLGLLFAAPVLWAQADATTGSALSDFERISIAPYISNQVEYLPAGARGNLQSKLGQLISSNGFGNSSYNTRFILTPNIEVASKNIVASAPPRVAVSLNVHLFVGDGLEGTKFGSTVVNVKGVGSNENKAYISALEQIKPGHPEVGRLISSAKERILAFYNSQCDIILKQSEVAAAQNDFDQALFILSSVPTINMDCYNKATELIAPVYQKKIDRDCQLHMAAARNAWNSGQNYDAAVAASKYLDQIDPAADCYRSVQVLSNEIGRRMKELDNREWNFILKEQDLEARQIDAARQVGVAYGQNQPENMTYNLQGWW